MLRLDVQLSPFAEAIQNLLKLGHVANLKVRLKPLARFRRSLPLLDDDVTRPRRVPFGISARAGPGPRPRPGRSWRRRFASAPAAVLFTPRVDALTGSRRNRARLGRLRRRFQRRVHELRRARLEHRAQVQLRRVRRERQRRGRRDVREHGLRGVALGVTRLGALAAAHRERQRGVPDALGVEQEPVRTFGGRFGVCRCRF
mmetsp:Transcript_8772/g.32157  ORF Transcript_8772/g.32157 Transcript_8772/m.32157 type:complete len:201 (+) Transcript_8772:2492-3094(+)